MSLSIVLRVRGELKTSSIMIGSFVFCIALCRSNMPFVPAVPSYGGFVPSAYVLCAIPATCGAFLLRSVATPVASTGLNNRRFLERALLILVFLLYFAVTLLLVSVVVSNADKSLLVSFGGFFVGLTLILSSLIGAYLGAIICLTTMLAIFAASLNSRVQDVLFSRYSTLLLPGGLALLAIGLLVGLVRGDSSHRVDLGRIPGLNDD